MLENNGNSDLTFREVYPGGRRGPEITLEAGGACEIDPDITIELSVDRDPRCGSPGLPYPDDNPKTIHGVKKAPLHLVPTTAVAAESLAFADGATKYDPYNWRQQNVSISVYYDACRRHLDAYWEREHDGADSGVSHLAHARACLAILIDAEECGTLNDDRPPGPPGLITRVFGRIQCFLERSAA